MEDFLTKLMFDCDNVSQRMVNGETNYMYKST